MKLPQPGEVFDGRYTIVDSLGKGGFATVYRATDSSGRTVALKILKPERDGYSRDIQARFTREVRVLASLRDPHTVRLFDHGEAQNGLLFMVFEYLPGRDLEAVLDEQGRLPPPLAIRILRQLCLGLREAHAHNLLHRDLKPANVRIFEYAGDPWRVKLLDFGIARAMMEGESNITKTGELIGTPRYMSPEQLMGSELGPTSDIYSLGLLGLEMLLGSDALQGNSWGAQIDRLLTGHVFSVPEIERIGIGLITVIQRMSARRPEDRYRTIDQVLDALDRVERGEPIPTVEFRPTPSAPPPSTASQSIETAAASQSFEIQRQREPSPKLTFVAILLIAVTTGLAVVVWKLAADEDPPAAPAKPRHDVPFVEGDQVEPTVTIEPAAIDAGIADASPPDLADFGTPGCGGPNLAGLHTLTHESSEWTLFVPTSYEPSKQHALVVAFHEDWQTPTTFLKQSQLHQSAEERGYVLMLPMDTAKLAWRTPGTVAHIEELVSEVQSRVCIDDDHIFLLGHASGGSAVEHLSGEAWVDAIAMVSYRAAQNADLHQVPPVPSLQLHATRGKRMPVDGGGAGPCAPEPKQSVVQAEEHWKERNRCSARSRPYKSHKNGKCLKYDCEADYVICRLDGGHGFPGGTNESPLGQIFCDPPPADFPAREVIFEFFDAQRD